MARNDWTAPENAAICVAYLIMATAEQAGETFNKSAIRRELRGTDALPGPLHARSNGSIEAKFMNCTAMAQRLGMPTVKGYKAAPNAQASLGTAMSQAWDTLQQEQHKAAIAAGMVKEAATWA